MLKNYEMMAILKPLLPDDVRKSVHKGIVELVGELGGTVLDVDAWGKRYLAYKIKGHKEGYYLVYLFTLESENVKEMKRKMRLNPEVIRSLIITVDDPESRIRSIKKKELDI
jgi:small subunit ribosomal protein S6